MPFSHGENLPRIKDLPALKVVACLRQYAADADFMNGLGDSFDAFHRARAGIAHRGEAAAKRFKSRQFARQVQQLRIERAFEGNPYPPENFRGFTEDQAFAETLAEMVMGVDETWHQ
ncbi:hypothetical protein D3C71_1684030 [compost metagenome]